MWHKLYHVDRRIKVSCSDVSALAVPNQASGARCLATVPEAAPAAAKNRTLKGNPPPTRCGKPGENEGGNDYIKALRKPRTVKISANKPSLAPKPLSYRRGYRHQGPKNKTKKGFKSRYTLCECSWLTPSFNTLITASTLTNGLCVTS